MSYSIRLFAVVMLVVLFGCGTTYDTPIDIGDNDDVIETLAAYYLFNYNSVLFSVGGRYDEFQSIDIPRIIDGVTYQQKGQFGYDDPFKVPPHIHNVIISNIKRSGDECKVEVFDAFAFDLKHDSITIQNILFSVIATEAGGFLNIKNLDKIELKSEETVFTGTIYQYRMELKDGKWQIAFTREKDSFIEYHESLCGQIGKTLVNPVLYGREWIRYPKNPSMIW